MSDSFEPHAEMPPEPMLSEAETRRLVERLEAQIKETERLEQAIATRPAANVEAEPVAIIEAVAELQLAAFLAGRGSTRVKGPAPSMDEFRRMATSAIASALEQVRKNALEEAAKVALTHMEAVAQHEYGKRIAAAIRTLAPKDQAHG